MTQHRIVSHNQLRDEMMAVARGERPEPQDAGGQSFESVDALLRLLTPENRQLLAIIRDRKPKSIAELATFSGRAAPNITVTDRSEPRYGGSERLCAGLEDCPVNAEPLSRVLTGRVPVIHADPTRTDAGGGAKAACLGGVGGRDKPGQDDPLKGLQL